MYPNDNRYQQNMPNMDNMNPPMYSYPMRNPSMDMNANRPPYDESAFYERGRMMPQPVYDYMTPPQMMPMNQGIDPRFSNWRQSSENKGGMLPTYYDRPPISEPYMHSKPPIPSIGYSQTYPSHEPLGSMRAPQLNILQRISYLIKPQIPELKKIMSRISNASSVKKKQSSRKQRSRERERQKQRDRSRSYEKVRKQSSTQWVCVKCSFLNFDWREKCKKCNESKPSFSSLNKNFTPGPEDWKCIKCGNLNYARRHQCNRCKLPKNNNGR